MTTTTTMTPLEGIAYLHGTLPKRPDLYDDFVARVARPLVDSDADVGAEQAAMALYRQASPFFICAAMVMMANRLEADDAR